MARALTAKDAHTLMNALVRQATGQSALSAVDASSFISCGETVLATGKENTFNALSLVIGRTLVASRPYKARLAILNTLNTGVYSHRIRKISYYAKDALPAGHTNSDLFTNHAQGFTAGENESGGTPQSTKSQYYQEQAMPLEVNFAGSSVWQDAITMYEDVLEQAFRSEDAFNNFIAGILTEHANDVESQREAFTRMALCSEIAKRYYLATSVNNYIPDGAINMTTAFNTRFGTNYTSAALRSTYLNDFLKFLVSTVKEISDRMTERSTHYHDAMEKTVDGVKYHILRHTPYDRQRILMYGPLLRDAEAWVMPEIFRPEYLDMDRQFEKVEFWQSNEADADRPKIKFNSAFLNHSNGIQSTTGNQTLDYVIACVYDVDALMVDMQLERATVSPLEARKFYRTSWLSFNRNVIGDQTENFVVLYMDDSDVVVDDGGDGE